MTFAIPPELLFLSRALAEAKIRLYAVGGFVRDQVLGWPCHDVDVCGPCLPQALEEAAHTLPWLQVISRDTVLGTVELRWQYADKTHSAEYTTFRTESYPPGGYHRPSQVKLAVTLQEDALRRDFTMNALYLSLPDGTLVDPLRGLRDVKKLVLRTTRNPDAVFSDDGLRLLRLVRFAASLRASIDRETWKGACRWVQLLKDIAPERISTELTAILLCDIPYPAEDGEPSPVYRALEMLRQMGALDILLPPMAPCFAIEQDPRYHDFDVGHHQMMCCSRIAPVLTLRLAALLHDIGKPMALEQHGKMLFHDALGAPVAETALLRLRYPKAIAKEAALLVQNHMYDLAGNARDRKLRWFFARMGYPMAQNWVDLRRADIQGSRARVLPGDPAWHWQVVLAQMQAEEIPDASRLLALSGAEIANLMGEKPSPRVGKMKELLWQFATEAAGNNTPPSLRKQLSIIMRSHPGFRKQQIGGINMHEYVIRGARLFTKEKLINGLELAVKGDCIAAISPEGTHTHLPVVDAKGLILTPGLIDIHNHGIAGHDCIEDDHEAIAATARNLPKYGVTGFLPTAMTFRLDAMAAMVKRAATETFEGATVLGSHLEGPFLDVAFKGAQEAQYMLPPSLEVLDQLCGAYASTVRLMTMDPAAPGAVEFIQKVSPRMTLSAGHSSSNYEDAVKAMDAGLRHVTHCFNAMRPLHHREPGLLGAALTEKDTTCEFIADLIHVHPAMLKMAATLKGKDRICLISDAMMATGLGAGQYTLGGQDVTVTEDGAARLANGTLAGSTLTLDKAVRNMVQKVGLPLEEVLPMATSTPAREIGEGHRRGKLEVGYVADMVLWTEDLQVADTYISGVRYPR